MLVQSPLTSPTLQSRSERKPRRQVRRDSIVLACRPPCSERRGEQSWPAELSSPIDYTPSPAIHRLASVQDSDPGWVCGSASWGLRPERRQSWGCPPVRNDRQVHPAVHQRDPREYERLPSTFDLDVLCPSFADAIPRLRPGPPSAKSGLCGRGAVVSVCSIGMGCASDLDGLRFLRRGWSSRGSEREPRDAHLANRSGIKPQALQCRPRQGLTRLRRTRASWTRSTSRPRATSRQASARCNSARHSLA